MLFYPQQRSWLCRFVTTVFIIVWCSFVSIFSLVRECDNGQLPQAAVICNCDPTVVYNMCACASGFSQFSAQCLPFVSIPLNKSQNIVYFQNNIIFFKRGLHSADTSISRDRHERIMNVPHTNRVMPAYARYTVFLCCFISMPPPMQIQSGPPRTHTIGYIDNRAFNKSINRILKRMYTLFCFVFQSHHNQSAIIHIRWPIIYIFRMCSFAKMGGFFLANKLK